MPTPDCRCTMIAQTIDAGPGLMVCQHYSQPELQPIIDNLDQVIQQFEVGVNPEFVLDSNLRDQLEAYLRDVWETARQQDIEAGQPDPGQYRPEFLGYTERLVLTIAFMRHMAIISQLLMAAIVEHLNEAGLTIDPATITDLPTAADAAAPAPSGFTQSAPAADTVPLPEPEPALIPPGRDPEAPLPNLPPTANA